MTIAGGVADIAIESLPHPHPPASVALLMIALGVFLIWLGLTGGGVWKSTATPGTAFQGPTSGGAGGGGGSGAD
jgi:hypothetical protein